MYRRDRAVRAAGQQMVDRFAARFLKPMPWRLRTTGAGISNCTGRCVSHCNKMARDETGSPRQISRTRSVV
ncbi:hypothetical protein SBBP1_530014 [Burkholderiales bacterium]|nr:hypothetical protein SBBP1_530014 [Burkholderiales bacterium]